jgi:hypothetical protein
MEVIEANTQWGKFFASYPSAAEPQPKETKTTSNH